MTMVDTLLVRLAADTAPLERELAQLAEAVEAAGAGVAAGFDAAQEGVEGLRERTAAAANDVGALGGAFDGARGGLDAIRGASGDLAQALGRVFAGGVSGARDLSDMLRQVENDLLRILFRDSVARPMADAVRGLFGGFNLATLFGGFFAEGGRPPVGLPSVVGEQGPELFVPDVAGTIVANDRLGGNVTVVQNISVAPDVSAVARAEVFRQLPLIRRHALAGVMDARQRGVAV
jgi:hypothetical protein